MESADETDDGPDFETREEWAAAAEARAIGGGGAIDRDLGAAGADDPIDDAMRPVYEAGGGEQDGFELAEHDLERNASHDDGEGFPELDAFTAEHESDRSTTDYGEADEEEHRDL